MRRINKGGEPNSLTVFKVNNPTLGYSDLNNGNESIRVDIRTSCIVEQFFLCAYCCNRITLDSSHNEHIVSQNSIIGRTLTLDFNNIVASCESKKNCGHKKANDIIALTPLMNECETEIIYQLNGKMRHTTPRAQSTINTLYLRNNALVNTRKQIIDLVLFEYVDDITNLILEDDYYLQLIIDEISQPDNQGKLEAFSPVIVNVLRQFIS
jgi:uncharacterized protein (TIGR02646 family)